MSERARRLAAAVARARQRARARGFRPLRDCPATLSPDQRAAWRDLVAAAPAPMAAHHALWVEIAACAVAQWRVRGGTRSDLRNCYRIIGEGLLSLEARRRLLFPVRH